MSIANTYLIVILTLIHLSLKIKYKGVHGLNGDHITRSWLKLQFEKKSITNFRLTANIYQLVKKLCDKT